MTECTNTYASECENLNRRKRKSSKPCLRTSVWSAVLAIELGLFPDCYFKYLTFVDPLTNVKLMKENRYSSARSFDAKTNDHEDVSKLVSTFASGWPFIKASKGTQTSARSTCRRSKKRRWTRERRKKPRDAPFEYSANACKRIDDERYPPMKKVASLVKIARSDCTSPGYPGCYSTNYQETKSHQRTVKGSKRFSKYAISDAENVKEVKTAACDVYKRNIRRRRSARFAERAVHQTSASSKMHYAIYGSITRRRNCRLDNCKRHADTFEETGKIARKRRGRRRKCVANNNYNSSRVSYDFDGDFAKRKPTSKSDIGGTRDIAKNMRKRYNCNLERHSYNFTNTVGACKRNLKNTATAIMRDVQASIRSAEIAKDAGNIRNTISEILADNPSEKCERDFSRHISMEYDWERNGEPDNVDASQYFKQTVTNPKMASAVIRESRRSRRKRLNRASIDCKFIDKLETTYQSDSRENCNFDSSTASAAPLKINLHESWRLEDVDVATIHSSWPRSSLTEGYSYKYNDTLTRETSTDDITEDSTGYEGTIAKSDRKNYGTPDISQAALIRKCSDDVENSKFENSDRETTKSIITYANKNRKTASEFAASDRDCIENQCDNMKASAEKHTKDCNLIGKNADDKSNNLNHTNDKTKAEPQTGEFHDMRRVTRALIKVNKENYVGKLVWGSCAGWWPALIIDAAHVGMIPVSGKLWVYWIGESQISLLNEKTQIEPFSSKLELRLTHNSHKNIRSRAIDATVQMLRQRFGCTLTKPYYYWIRRNITRFEKLDDLYFYPYPRKIQERLDVLKSKNAKITEQYVSNRKSTPESTKKQTTEKPKDTTAFKQMEEERLPLQLQTPGVIAWAKITGHNWWPAMIIDYRDCCLKEPSFGCQWIMWYGDYRLSEVHHLAFLRFHKGIEKMRDYIQKTKKHVYLTAVLQASKDYCSRLGCNTDDWTLDSMFEYFLNDNNVHVPCKQLQISESTNKIYDKYSDEIVKRIHEYKSDPNVDDKRKDDIKESNALRCVTFGESSVENLCLKCLKFPDDVMEEHPFFVGSLCKECSHLFKPCMFVFGNDGKCFYCTVCSGTGIVVICDREDCPRVYCTACLKFLICPEAYDDMLSEDPWECFLCRAESKQSSNGLLRPRLDWKEKMIGIFRTNSKPLSNYSYPVEICENEKRGIRVLSLFDGLSTGLLVLLKLRIVVDVYYASEIDKDALMISSAHFGDRIHYLGDIRNIKKNKVEEIAPIDLLIGGSPCNDLSTVNPARLGLHDPKGTGILFFEYCRILKQLTSANKNHQLFWLYENVASMPSEYRLEMNKHLGQEPDVIDSADFSPQHRLRLYWHNFPFNPHFPSYENQQDVQDVLTPHCNRYALVKKIRTVTTKKNSLQQGKLALRPILMKDESDSLWITELEEIFGFPRHYTDVKNLSATNRQRLIGKSWSVQTLIAILRPLCSFFKCNEVETN